MGNATQEMIPTSHTIVKQRGSHEGTGETQGHTEEHS